MSILAFGAHPDDIEFGCGAVLAGETRAGNKAHLVVGSRGESGTNGTPEIRTAEAEAAAGHLRATLEFVDLGGDAHFERSAARAVLLAGIIRRIRPDVVLAPTTAENQHPDHTVLGHLVRDAARLARYGGLAELRGSPPHAIGQLLHYAVTPNAEPSDLAPVFVDVSHPETVSAWKAAMEAHASQLQTRNYVEWQLARARFAGARVGLEFATALFPADPILIDSIHSVARGARRF